MNEKCRLMQLIYETGFALDDAALFLDTHPCDPQAIQFYETTRSYYQQAVRDYTSQFGPLSHENARFTESSAGGCQCGCQDSTDGTTCWNWVQEPWPWEGGMV